MLDRRKDECRNAFERALKAEDTLAKKPLAPVSVRLTYEERARLEKDAGDRTLSAYIRFCLFGAEAKVFPTLRPKRKRKRPTPDQVILGQLLGVLGESRLASNLNQIAKAANMGALPMTEDLKDELHRACKDVREMRDLLMSALGKSPS